MNPIPRVQLACQFGTPVRGLSPYGDALIEALRARGDVDIVAVDYEEPFPAIVHPAQQGAPPRVEGGIHWRKPGSWSTVANAHADILHLQHWVAPMSLYLGRLARLSTRAGKRVAVTVHNARPHERAPLWSAMETGFLRRADLLIVHDDRGAETLRSRLGGAPRIAIIPHGTRPSAQPQAAQPGDHQRFGLDPSRRYLLLFGNLRGYKGVPLLLQAWGRIAERWPSVDLVVAGRLWNGRQGLASRLVSAALGTRREAFAIESALGRIEDRSRVHVLEGFLPDGDLDVLIRLADAAVFPYTRFASQSGAACRAASLGCPLIVSDVGGLPRLAIGPEWIARPGDVESLVATLESALAVARKPSVRELQWRLAGRDNWALVAERHARVYAELL